jgi:hypothetical protein
VLVLPDNDQQRCTMDSVHSWCFPSMYCIASDSFQLS